jgi:hypothetical protein
MRISSVLIMVGLGVVVVGVLLRYWWSVWGRH